MNYLLDTCVLSEFARRQPDQRVMDWLNAMEEEKLHISVITVGEIQRGIERLPKSHRKTELLLWVNNGLLMRFAERMMAIDAPTMFLWGSLVARLEAVGQPMGLMDSLILASALQNNLIIATRNVADFLPGGVQVINPWE
jgi:predicted nucleic acid-binding protein